MRKSLLIALEDDTSYDSSYSDTYQDDGQALIEENQAASEVDSLGENIGRSIEIAEALESLVEIIEDKEELTPTERGLIQVAGNMAVAGTDTDSNALVPATESMSVSVAVETIKERLSQAVERIKTATSQMGEKISDFVSKTVYTFKSARNKIADLKKRFEAAKASGALVDGEVEVGNHSIFHTGAEGQVAKSTADVKKMSDTVISTASGFAAALEQNLKVLSKDVTFLQQVKDLAKIEETATKFFNDTLQMTQGLVKDAKLVKSGTENGADVYKSKLKYMNTHIEVSMPSSSDFDLTTYDGIKAASGKFSISFGDGLTTDDGNNSPVTLKVRVADIETLLGGLEDSLTTATSIFQRLYEQTKNATALINKVFSAILRLPLFVTAVAGGLGAGANAAAAGIVAGMGQMTPGLALKAAGAAGINAGVGAGAAYGAMYTGSALGAVLFSHKMALLNNTTVYRAANVAKTMIQFQVFDTMSFINQLLRKSGKKAPVQTENQGTPQE